MTEPTQRQHFYIAHRKLADMLNLFAELCSDPKRPLTVEEMEKMTARHPERYGFMQPTIDHLRAEGRTTL